MPREPTNATITHECHDNFIRKKPSAGEHTLADGKNINIGHKDLLHFLLRRKLWFCSVEPSQAPVHRTGAFDYSSPRPPQCRKVRQQMLSDFSVFITQFRYFSLLFYVKYTTNIFVLRNISNIFVRQIFSFF